MPGAVTEQSLLWASAFGGNAAEFTALAGNATDFDCSDKMDLVFVLDSSDSVSSSSFVLMRSFAADVVQVMDVDGDVVRVADIVYGSHVQEEFDLNDFRTAADVRSALLTTVKLGGGTQTNDALDRAAVTLYDVTNGARSDAKKVVILITDGMSFDPAATVTSAVVLKDRGSTVFAIGVDSYDLAELTAVSSSPHCSHVFTLTQFSSILSILTQIQISTCDASLVLTPGDEVWGRIPEVPVQVATRTLNPGPNSTIVVSTVCGHLDIYVSQTERSPSPVLHERRYTATNGTPAVLTPGERDGAGQGDPVYVTLVATRQAESTCSRYEWSISVGQPGSAARLVGGRRESEGRVEVFTDGSWGTVCDDTFDLYDAIVVCRMLGYQSLVPEVHGDSHYGEGQGTIWLDQVACSGAESSLFQCAHAGVGIHDCKHSEDVGVDCAPANASSLTLVRLVNGTRPSEGRLEVSIGGVWGTVCNNGFDVTDASVVCSMLNFTGGSHTVAEGGQFEPGTGPIWMDNVDCTGSEGSLFLCPHRGPGHHDCSHAQDVGLVCGTASQGSGGSSTGITSSSSSTGVIIAGVVAGGVALTALTVAAAFLRKYLTARTAVQDLRSQAEREGDPDTSRSQRSDDSSSEDSFPIPALDAGAPGMRMPADTHLPPLTNTNPRFPPLRS
ncbi:uncharacterized protein LOC143289600 isoform X2 [Babylonia areolata]|uniref:uncharacterized protein LOC143289600 isoform X2 n=1 Tax=Babylonia areolata TaxID=304850 RepID=UPI003FCFC094